MRALKTGLVAGVVFLGGCSGDDHLHILNGFEFPVTVTLTTQEGKSETHQVPALGRVTTDLQGTGTVKAETASGGLISENKANFGQGKDGKSPCPRALNIEGAAAIVQEGIEYGNGFGAAQYSLKAGWISESFCTASWVFEDPPEAIAVDQHGPAGRTKDWVHYVGDGSWKTSVDALLEDQGEFKGQSRGRAQRIVRTVVTHDPQNPKLADVQAKFKATGLIYPKAGE